MRKIPSDMVAGTKHATNNNGVLEIVEYVNARTVHVCFVNTGYITVTCSDHVRDGNVKDKLKPTIFGVAYMGDGQYPVSVRGKDTQQYTTWKNMLKRCYDQGYLERKPTYIGCSVAKEWHNFQTFAKWYDEHYPTDGKKYQLDKDIKVKGNKIYSSETCLFVTQKENSVEASAKSYVFLTPNKERVDVYNLADFCREMGLNSSHMVKVASGKLNHHRGWTKSCK